MNDAAGCKLGNSGGAEYGTVGCGFAAMGDGFRLRLVDGEELSGDIRSARTARYRVGEVSQSRRTGAR